MEEGEGYRLEERKTERMNGMNRRENNISILIRGRFNEMERVKDRDFTLRKSGKIE